MYDRDFNLVWSGDVYDSGKFLSGAWYPGTYYVEASGYPGFTGLAGCAFYDSRPCPVAGQDPASVLPTPIVLSRGEIRPDIDFRLDADSIFRSGFDS